MAANATPMPEARIAAAIKEIKSALAEIYPGRYITSRAAIRDNDASIAVGASFFKDDVAMAGFVSRDFLERLDRGEIGARAEKNSSIRSETELTELTKPPSENSGNAKGRHGNG
ncbi:MULTISPECIES: hypothetical protein [unclassified Xanthobacter]|uniref:hypothetical protein n=1 Tax=unclassified Xanthobacter TaxID=2623496 RepID=UPI001F48C097|nr:MULTISPECIES: hypothetical protein [unclassified Xanthobacter]